MNYIVTNNETAPQNSTQSQQQLPIHLTINNYQNNDTKQAQNNANTNANTHTNVNSNSNATATAVSLTNQLKQTILKLLNFAKKEGAHQQQIALSFLQQHKQIVLFCLLGCTYGLLFAYLFTLHTFLSDNEKWHGWKREHSLEDLVMCDTNELAHALLVAIQQKYFNPRDPVNTQKPFVRFYNDILIEVHKIDRYLQIGNIIHRFQLSYFFPVTKKRLKRASEKRKKLGFMQKLLITHMATQNSFPITRSYQFDMLIKKTILSRLTKIPAQPRQIT